MAHAKLAATEIRKELQKSFPGFKFSVKSTYDKVVISWTNGMTVKEVEEITSKYQYGSFDGMTDSYNYDNRNESIPQAKYIFTDRQISDLATELKLKEIQETWNGAENLGLESWFGNARCYVSQLIHRELYNHTFQFEGQYL